MAWSAKWEEVLEEHADEHKASQPYQGVAGCPHRVSELYERVAEIFDNDELVEARRTIEQVLGVELPA